MVTLTFAYRGEIVSICVSSVGTNLGVSGRLSAPSEVVYVFLSVN